MRKWSNEELAEIMEYFAQPSGIFCTFWKGVEVRKAQRALPAAQVFVKRDQIAEGADFYPVYLHGRDVSATAARALGKGAEDAVELDNYAALSLSKTYPFPWLA